MPRARDGRRPLTGERDRRERARTFAVRLRPSALTSQRPQQNLRRLRTFDRDAIIEHEERHSLHAELVRALFVRLHFVRVAVGHEHIIAVGQLQLPGERAE